MIMLFSNYQDTFPGRVSVQFCSSVPFHNSYVACTSVPSSGEWVFLIISIPCWCKNEESLHIQTFEPVSDR